MNSTMGLDYGPFEIDPDRQPSWAEPKCRVLAECRWRFNVGLGIQIDNPIRFSALGCAHCLKQVV